MSDATETLQRAPPRDIEDVNAKCRQILDGARAVFARDGFDAASMNELARVAGVSKGTLYVYFDSKEALFEALVYADRRRQAEQLFVLDADDHDVAGVLRHLGLSLMESMSRPESIAQVRTILGVVNRFPAIGRAFFEAGPAFGARRLAAWLDDQVAAGALRCPDTVFAAQQFIDLCMCGHSKQLWFRVIDEPDPAMLRRGVDGAVAMFMAAYGESSVVKASPERAGPLAVGTGTSTGVEDGPMSDVTYTVVEHDGGWAYKLGAVFSETFPTREQAAEAVKRVMVEQERPGETDGIEYQDRQGHWHQEVARGDDRPHTHLADEED